LQINELKEVDIDDIDNQIINHEANIVKCEASLDTFNKEVATREANIQHCHAEHKKIGTDADICPTCLKSVTHDDRDKISTRKSAIDSEIKDFKNDIKDLNTRISTYVKLKTKLKDTINQQRDTILKSKDINAHKTRKQQLETWNEEIDQDLKVGKTNAAGTIVKAIKDTEDKIADIKSEISRISKKIEMLETIKFIVSEEGVKSYIVKKILNLFNSKLAYYLKRMDANCQCTFNENFEEEIISEKGKHCSYFNFSGAERKNIDLACLFAFMDIRRMQGDVAYNISVYDELFDSSLDEKGVELVLEILKERVEKHNECIMVISHRKESIKAATGDIIFLEKENGITRRIDYN